MDIKVSIGDIVKQKVEAIIVNLFEGVDQPGGATGAVDREMGGLISDLMASGEIRGKEGEVTILHTKGKIAPERVLVIGLGKQSAFDINAIRAAGALACQTLKRIGVQKAATIIHGAGAGSIDIENAIQALVEGSLLGLYEFRNYMTVPADRKEPAELDIVELSGDKKDMLEGGVRRGVVFAEAVKLVRDMGNEPANIMTPSRMAEIATDVSKRHGLLITIMDKVKMTELGMGGILGVSQGSHQEPKLIIMEYRGDSTSKESVGLVGKGITFDSGGISIKPGEGMKDMKGDMAGGAAVIAVIEAIATLKPKINVIGIVPATENMPDGSALKPGDVIKAMNGKTIEIINTDAEGRLILADALCYGVKMGLTPLIDVATLTGACRIALGDICTGAFTNDQKLLNDIIGVTAKSGEYIWQMPMFPEYRNQIKSDVADVQNVGNKLAGAITAAKFLEEFVEKTPWVHLDIAGTSIPEKPGPFAAKGATGVMVRTLAAFLLEKAGK